MRKRVVTTVLTIGGVVVAGSAAALVNSSLLGSQSSSMIIGRSADEPIVDLTLPDDGVPVTGTSLPSQPVRRSGTAAEYTVGVAGMVTLDTADGELTVLAADPATGWTVVAVDDGDEVRVVFRSAATDITFRANLLYGVVNTSLEVRSRSVSPGDDSTDDEVDGQPADDHGTDSTIDDSDDDVDEPDDTEVDDDSVDDTVVDDKNDD